MTTFAEVAGVVLLSAFVAFLLVEVVTFLFPIRIDWEKEPFRNPDDWGRH